MGRAAGTGRAPRPPPRARPTGRFPAYTRTLHEPAGLFLLVLFALTLIGGRSHAPRADAADLNVLVVDDPADDAEAGAPEITQVTVAHNEAGNVVRVRVWVAGGTDLAADPGIAVSFDQDLDGDTGCIPPITIRAARQVGNILKYVGPEDPVEPRYANYM